MQCHSKEINCCVFIFPCIVTRRAYTVLRLILIFVYYLRKENTFKNRLLSFSSEILPPLFYSNILICLYFFVFLPRLFFMNKSSIVLITL